MGRGERGSGHRGSEEFRRYGGQGSNDERWDPADPDQDPIPAIRDDFEDLQDPANDEYIWPTIEDEPDD
jgi:hypothetical protein